MTQNLDEIPGEPFHKIIIEEIGPPDKDGNQVLTAMIKLKYPIRHTRFDFSLDQDLPKKDK